jgi:uncharacterized protein
LQALLQLQLIDTRIDRLKAAIAVLDTGAQLAADYNKKKTEAVEKRSLANKAQAAQHETELKLSSIETKASQVNKTLYGGTVTGSRELDNLQKELEMLARQKSTVEDEVLTAMEAASEAVAAADTAEAELAALAQEYRKVRTAFQLRQEELTLQIDRLAPDRDDALQAVANPNLLSRYDQIRGKRAGVGAALLGTDASCGACHTSVSSQQVEHALTGAIITVCENCGRILVPGKRV